MLEFTEHRSHQLAHRRYPGRHFMAIFAVPDGHRHAHQKGSKRPLRQRRLVRP